MSRALRCDWCQELEEQRPRLVWQLSLPARNDGRPGRVFDFCSDECLRDFVADRMNRRAAERAAADAPGAAPSPLDVPARVAS